MEYWKKFKALCFIFALSLLCVLSKESFAQKEWSVFGKVINHKSKSPVGSITITNKRTRSVVVTNKEGDFYIRAAFGDSLIATGIGFGKLGFLFKEGMKNVRIELNQEAIALEEVVITDKKNETLEKEIKRFLEETPNAASMKRDIIGNVVSTAPLSTGAGGIGISIDALYDLWSKEGKANRKAAELEYQDLKQFYVSLRYNKRKVAVLTSLEGQELDDFMTFCKLSNDFVLSASDYDLNYEILNCRKNFKRSFFPRVEN
jgi:hypothetical protein